MENVNFKDEALRCMGDILSEVRLANAFVVEGKEVACDRRLQGVRARLLNFIDFIKLIPDDIHVAQETFKERQPTPQSPQAE